MAEEQVAPASTTTTIEYKSKYAINPPTDVPRVSQLIWGPSGCGKTVLAYTAPAKRLVLQFDPDGSRSVKNDPVNNLVMDLSKHPPDIVNEAKSSHNPFGVDDLLKNHQDIRTVIVDSVTAFATQATAYSAGHTNAPGAVFENPSMSGYGFRNRFTLGLCKNLLAITGKHNRNIIFICHEDVPKLNTKGEIISITILLGGSLPEEVPLQISEVWNMRDGGKDRFITVRSAGYRKPMKSRMFDTSRQIEFKSTYDALTGKGLTLEQIYNDWKNNNYNKITLPPG